MYPMRDLNAGDLWNAESSAGLVILFTGTTKGCSGVPKGEPAGVLGVVDETGAVGVGGAGVEKGEASLVGIVVVIY